MFNFKKKKYLISLIAILSCFSLTALGFSSFIVSSGSSYNEVTSDANFSYGEVVTGTNYISLNLNRGDSNSGIEMFKYNSKGFVVDETVTYDASIVFFLKLNSYDFYTDYKADLINFKLTLKYANEFTSSYTLLTSSCLNTGASQVLYFEGSAEQEENVNANANISADDTEKTILAQFSYYFDKNNIENNKYTWFKIVFNFTSSSSNYSNLYTNEFNLANNTPKYVLNVEIS